MSEERGNGTAYDLVVIGDQVVNGDRVGPAGIAVRGERIAALLDVDEAQRPGLAAHTIDARGKIVLPGAIDAHVHLRTMNDAADSWESVTRAAAHGGVTTIIAYVQGPVGMPLGEAMRRNLDDAQRDVLVDVAAHCRMNGPSDDVFDQIADVFDLGIPSFKFFMAYRKRGIMWDGQPLMRALATIGERGGIWCCHAENGDLIDYLEDRYIERDAYRPGDLSGDAPARRRDRGRVPRDPGLRPSVQVSTLHRPHHRGRRAAVRQRGSSSRPAGGRRDVPTVPDPDRRDHAPGRWSRQDRPADAHPGRYRRALGRAGARRRRRRRQRPRALAIRQQAPTARRVCEDLLRRARASRRSCRSSTARASRRVDSRCHGWPRCSAPPRPACSARAQGPASRGMDADLVVIDPAVRWTLDEQTLHSEAGLQQLAWLGAPGQARPCRYSAATLLDRQPPRRRPASSRRARATDLTYLPRFVNAAQGGRRRTVSTVPHLVRVVGRVGPMLIRARDHRHGFCRLLSRFLLLIHPYAP